MSKSPLLLTAVVLLGVATLAPAQRTWIVDAANGKGTDYKDLPAAVAAAKDGDRIVLRRGTYKPVTTSKGIIILGDNDARISTAFAANFVVEKLAAGKRFVLHNCTLVPGYSYQLGTGKPPIVVKNCKGSVHLSSLTVGVGTAHRHVFSITNCAAVSLSGCYLIDPVSISGGRVLISSTTFVAEPGLQVSGANVTLWDNRLQGRGSYGGMRSPTSAMETWGSDITVLSGKILGGSTSIFGWGASEPGIRAHGGTLTMDPRATISGTPKGFSKVTKREMPLLRVSTTLKPSVAAINLSSRKKRVFAIYASLETQPLANMPEVWLDMRFLVLIDAGTVGSSGTSSKVVPIPTMPSLLGLIVAFQEVEIVGPSLQFSNPAFIIVGR